MDSISVPIILRNAVKLRYPIKRVVGSVYDLADEIVLSVDPTSEDNSVSYVYALARNKSKIKVIESAWNLNNTNNGSELSKQTNFAIDNSAGSWILVIQADEAVHENSHITIKREIEEATSSGIDAYAMYRLYFYKDLKTVRKDWTHNIVRLFRRGTRWSCGDAMNTEGSDKTMNSNAYLYHYSRIGDPNIIPKRILSLDRLFHPRENLLEEGELKEYDFKTRSFDCMCRDGVDVGKKSVDPQFVKFYGTHPKPFQGYKGM